MVVPLATSQALFSVHLPSFLGAKPLVGGLGNQPLQGMTGSGIVSSLG